MIGVASLFASAASTFILAADIPEIEPTAEMTRPPSTTIRLAQDLFTQKPKGEMDDFLNWVKTST